MNSFPAVAAAVPELEKLLRQWQPEQASEVERKVEAILSRLERDREAPAPLHEPNPLPRSLSPRGGEGDRRAGVGAGQRFNARIRSRNSLPAGNDAKVILAAGGLVWRGPLSARRIAVIHRNRYNDWSLPKGKRKADESLPVAARREVWEETGCQPRLTAFAGLLLYPAGRRPKLVFFWHMDAAEAGQFEPSSEVDQVEWLTVPEALRRLTYDIERDLLKQAVVGSPA